MRVTGTGAHHQNGLVERANQTMDKEIRAMLIGTGLPVKFWPCAFRHFLRIKNSALPRCNAMESAHQKLHGEKDNLGLLQTFGCRLWVKILAWQNRAKYIHSSLTPTSATWQRSWRFLHGMIHFLLAFGNEIGRIHCFLLKHHPSQQCRPT